MSERASERAVQFDQLRIASPFCLLPETQSIAASLGGGLGGGGGVGAGMLNSPHQTSSVPHISWLMVLSLVQSRMVLWQCLTGLTLFLCKNKKTVLLLFKAEIYAAVGRYPHSLSLSLTHTEGLDSMQNYIYIHTLLQRKQNIGLVLCRVMQGTQKALKD